MRTVEEIKSMKGREKISMLTCYDFSMARIIDGTVDIVLVGDSLGMVMLGHKDTKSVTMQDMIRATESVARGAKSTLITGDMPINSYCSKDVALENAKSFLSAGAHAVKIEGCHPGIISHLTANGIPVQGHIGYLPQSGGRPRIHGKEEDESKKLVEEALSIQKAGAFSVVFELLPPGLSSKITNDLSIPTIGIGSGPYCDGQVLVIHDILGLYNEISPKFVKRYVELGDKLKSAAEKFSSEVKGGVFPSPDSRPSN